MRLDLIQKVWEKTKQVGPCWIYTGQKTKIGHGQIGLRNKIVSVHRLSLCIYLGLNYDDHKWQANHICSNPDCWNPLHLYAGTQLENVKDFMLTGKHVFASRTHCSKGHEYTPENTYYRNNGRHRHCRRCRADNIQSSRMKKLTLITLKGSTG